MSNNIFFNDMQIPDFVIVKSIETQLLPDINNIFIKSDRGVKHKKIEFGSKVVKIDFSIERGFKSLPDITLIDTLNSWLKGDDWKPSKLVLPNDLDSHYLAIADKIDPLKPDSIECESSIEFLCVEPDRITTMEKVVAITNTGRFEYTGENTKPIIIFKITSQCEELKLSISNKKYKNFIRLKHNFILNDVVKIDMSTKKVTLNDNLKMTILTLDSRFHDIVEGDNIYTLELGNAIANIKFNERRA